MKKLWLVLLFLLGGIAHEVRNPTNCQSIATRDSTEPRKRARK